MAEHIRAMIESKEQLLLDVSHELRSPLARIAVALEVPGSEDIIRRNLREMDAMIAELLESARLPSANGALQLTRTDLVALISEVASRFSGDLPGVRLLEPPSELLLELDPRRVRGVFKNVIENAIKFSSKDGPPVEISFEPRGVGKSQNELEIVVRDFGVGISEKDIALVFEPFYRVEKSRCKDTGGYGLGLNISQRIMKAHGGDIRLHSLLGKGTRVSLIFPR
jgi:signal transduction histidine kinase